MHFSLHRLTVFILTLTIGLSVAWFADLMIKAEMLVTKVSPSSIFKPMPKGEVGQF